MSQCTELRRARPRLCGAKLVLLHRPATSIPPFLLTVPYKAIFCFPRPTAPSYMDPSSLFSLNPLLRSYPVCIASPGPRLDPRLVRRSSPFCSCPGHNLCRHTSPRLAVSLSATSTYTDETSSSCSPSPASIPTTLLSVFRCRSHYLRLFSPTSPLVLRSLLRILPTFLFPGLLSLLPSTRSAASASSLALFASVTILRPHK